MKQLLVFKYMLSICEQHQEAIGSLCIVCNFTQLFSDLSIFLQEQSDSIEIQHLTIVMPEKDLRESSYRRKQT